MEECCLLLRGEFFIREALPECPPVGDLCEEKNAQYVKVGNTSTCEIEIDSRIMGRENVFNRVNPKNRVAIDRVGINITIECVNKKNLIEAINGTEIKEESSSIKERFCFSRSNNFLITKYRPENLVVSALDSFGNLVRFLIEGVDFTRDGSKIEIINFDNIDPIVESLELEYEFSENKIFSINALSGFSKYKDIFFKGKNISDNTDVEVRFYRVLLSPMGGFDLISKDQFFNLPLVGVVEESNNGYFRLTQQEEGSDESGSVIY